MMQKMRRKVAKGDAEDEKEEDSGREKEKIVLGGKTVRSTDVEQPVPGGRRDAKSPNFCPVEQRVPPIFGVPNAGRNAIVPFRSVSSRPTYQTHP